MPRPSDRDYFVLLCSDTELRNHLDICTNSEFQVTRHEALGCLIVMDRETPSLMACRFGGSWQVRLHRAYYRHPFGPPSDGNAMPGVT